MSLSKPFYYICLYLNQVPRLDDTQPGWRVDKLETDAARCVRKRDLYVSKRDLYVGKKDLNMGKRDLYVGKRDLYVSNRDLYVGKRDLIINKQKTQCGRHWCLYLNGDTSVQILPADPTLLALESSLRCVCVSVCVCVCVCVLCVCVCVHAYACVCTRSLSLGCELRVRCKMHTAVFDDDDEWSHILDIVS